MTKFLLIRHALTDGVGKRLSGRADGVMLNEEGCAQAEHLALRLAGLPIAAVYSSPLQRAIETATPIAKLLNLQSIIYHDLVEVDFGEWTNCLIEEVKKQDQFQLFNYFRSCVRIPGGESMLEAQLRMIKALEQLGLQHKHQTIAVVSHGDLIKAAVAHFAGIHLDMFRRIEISPASISIIEVYEETARIMVVNDTGQLG